jgi:NAD(P)-dependent dehydrogenase (short-subunit alcohol dehydrogenase family)
VQGKVVVISGATSGIGLETARGLVALGAHVVVVGRNPDKTTGVVAELKTAGPGRADMAIADFASLASVRTLATELSERFPKIDVLVSNAGVVCVRRRLTTDGFEETFAVNHLAAFTFVNLMADVMKASAPSRIVIVASDAHFGISLDFDDLQHEHGFKTMRAYRRSKLANVMFGYSLARRLDGSGVTVNSLHPGFVATNLGSGNRIPVKPFMWLFRLTGRAIDVRDGADTPIYLTSSDEVGGESGKYFDVRKAKMSSPQSYDEDAQERLWSVSESMTGLSS